MELGSEFAKGAAEKALGVKLPILMRIVLPGLLATAAIYPAVRWILSFLPSDTDHWWQRIIAYLVLVFLLGALVSTFSSEIYKIYEGRSFWPQRLFDWGRRRQQARVERLRGEAERSKSAARYDELWYQLRIYPVNEQADPEATHPTELGNILAGYEQYPNNRYGVDSVFWWPRLWLQIDKDVKSEVDCQWSVADGFLILSAISFAAGVLWIGQSAAALAGFGLAVAPLGSATGAFLAGLGWLAAGGLLYRLSLPFHRANGELFKAIFDVYRGKVWSLTELNPNEKATWRASWAYLQYALLQCPNCQKGYNSVASEKCANCGFGLGELNASFLRTGKLR